MMQTLEKSHVHDYNNWCTNNILILCSSLTSTSDLINCNSMLCTTLLYLSIDIHVVVFFSRSTETDRRTTVLVAVRAFVMGRSSTVPLPGRIRLRRFGAGDQQMVRRDLAEDRRKSRRRPVEHRARSTFRFDGSKFSVQTSFFFTKM